MADSIPPQRYPSLDTVAFTYLGREYTVQTIIRMVVIIGGYILVRGLFLQFSKKHQMAAHEREIDITQETSDAGAAPLKHRIIGGDYESDGENWGSGARRRERAARKVALAEAERRNLEEETADIDKYLD